MYNSTIAKSINKYPL